LEPNLPTAGLAAAGVACDVAAFAAVRATAAELPGLRQQPGPAGHPLPPAFLKHADEQTVVALAAVSRAIDAGGLAGTDFRDWGAVASPRFLGRVAMAAAVQRFAREGAWGVSPHLIPHRSLHSISGTVSQALKLHGPNFGSGGGPGGAEEALLTATTLLQGGSLRGVWLVLTGWDPEPVPDAKGAPPAGVVCAGLALALTPARAGWPGLRLRVAFGPPGRNGSTGQPAGRMTPLSLEALLETLGGVNLPAAVLWQLGGGGWLELERGRTGNGTAAPRKAAAANGACQAAAPGGAGTEKMS